MKIRFMVSAFFLFVTFTACQKPGESSKSTPTQTQPSHLYADPAAKESPLLAKRVAAGELPPLEQRLPEQPKVIQPRDRMGQYCDAWDWTSLGIANFGGFYDRNNHCSLVRWSMDWKSMEPGLAERYEVSDDGRIFTFYLRKGLKYSDGHPFTTEDIEFSYTHVLKNRQLLMNPPPYLEQDEKLARLEVLDKYTFRFIFNRPKGDFFLHFSGASVEMLHPKHYLSQFMPPFISEAKADSIAQEAGFAKWTAYFTSVLSWGWANPDLPVLRPWRRITPRGKAESHWVLERNPYYYTVDPDGRQLPYLDRVVVTNAAEMETLTLRVISGEVDCQFRNIDARRARLFLQNEERGDYRVSFFPNTYPMALSFNFNKIDDPAGRALNQNQMFRYALSLAINRAEVDKLLNWGTGQDIPRMVVPPEHADEKKVRKWFDYDPDRAKFLLDSLELKKDNDGWRVRPDGEPIILECIFTDSTPIDWLELVQEYWTAVGIRIKLKQLSYRSWWDYMQADQYDIVASAFMLDTDRNVMVVPHNVFPYLSVTPWAGRWGEYYRNHGVSGEKAPPEFDWFYETWEELLEVLDPVEQQEIIDEMRYHSFLIGHSLYVKSQMPAVLIIKNNFHNVSEGVNRADWVKRGPAPDFPETYFED